MLALALLFSSIKFLLRSSRFVARSIVADTVQNLSNGNALHLIALEIVFNRLYHSYLVRMQIYTNPAYARMSWFSKEYYAGLLLKTNCINRYSL